MRFLNLILLDAEATPHSFEKKFSNWEKQRLKRLYFQISYSMILNFANNIIAQQTLKFWSFSSDFDVSRKTKKNNSAVIYLCQIQVFKLCSMLLMFYRNSFCKIHLIN